MYFIADIKLLFTITTNISSYGLGRLYMYIYIYDIKVKVRIPMQ